MVLANIDKKHLSHLIDFCRQGDGCGEGGEGREGEGVEVMLNEVLKICKNDICM